MDLGQFSFEQGGRLVHGCDTTVKMLPLLCALVSCKLERVQILPCFARLFL